MKRLKAGGLGVHTKQAEPITPDKEELLWSKNLLGAHSPQTYVRIASDGKLGGGLGTRL